MNFDELGSLEYTINSQNQFVEMNDNVNSTLLKEMPETLRSMFTELTFIGALYLEPKYAKKYEEFINPKYEFKYFYELKKELKNWIKQNKGEEKVIIAYAMTSPFVELLDYEKNELYQMLESFGEPKYRVDQLVNAIYSGKDYDDNASC